MRILHVAAECYPLIRTGGLGDVAGALPVATRQLGHDARLLLPGYPDVLAGIEIAGTYPLPADFPASGRLLFGTLAATGLPIYALDVPARFARPGNPYLGPDGADWPDNAERFGSLSLAAVLLAVGTLDPGWHADIVHAHDWHTGLVPAYRRAAGLPTPCLFTVHNMAFQGLFPADTAATLGLPGTMFQPDGLEFWNQLSFLKAGLVYADRVTTVSPTYAREIATAPFGCGLDGVVADRGVAVTGVLNGVDETVWNSAADPFLKFRFDEHDLSARAANRIALTTELGLRLPAGPLFGVVSRLTDQKGLDLLLEALPAVLEENGALALLGSGDTPLENAFRAAAAAAPERIAVTIGYDDGLSHRLMAGCDAMLVPSRFEPCGLTQLYALRYGAVPIVRRTGGLADTVRDAATGFVFEEASTAALAEAIGRAAAAHQDRAAWQALQLNGMRQRFTWREAAQSYSALYNSLTSA